MTHAESQDSDAEPGAVENRTPAAIKWIEVGVIPHVMFF